MEHKKDKVEEEHVPETNGVTEGEELEEIKNGETVLSYDALKQEADGYLDSLQRERASFANYRKRVEQEKAELFDRSLGEHVKIFFPVIDDLERALKHRPKDEDSNCASWADGIALILQKLLKTLESKGVTPLEIQPGDAFDPNTQEAVTHEEHDEFHDHQIIEVVQTGYKLKDRIIRPAMVRVAK